MAVTRQHLGERRGRLASVQDFTALGLRVLLIGTLLVPGVGALAQSCPTAPGQGNLCTAKDFTVTSAIVSGPTECTNGETISVRVRVGLTSTANQRYDIGIFTGDNGEPVFGGASCSLDALVPLEPPFDADSGVGGYRNLDGDACGDVSEPDGEVFKDVQLDNVLCQDNDGDGQVDISGIVTWSSNASQDVCTDPTNPANFFPSSSSKCILDPDFNLPIIVEPLPSLRVFKLALPGNLPAPGGNVRFVVDVNNNSTGTDTITLTGIVDDVHGDVTQVQGDISQTSCSVPQTLVAGQSYTCDFRADVSGPPGYVEIDTITVVGEDDEGNPVSAVDFAQVEIGDSPASILVGKSVAPTVVPEPGGEVTYYVLVANESDTEPVTIDTLDDDLYGSLSGRGDCPTLPFNLAPGSIMQCKFTETVTGDPGDVVVDVITADGPVIDPKSDDAQVRIADVAASIEATKTAIPESLPEPGGTFTFEVQVQNTSPRDDVTITALTDNVYGNLDGRGSCSVGAVLAPGDSYTCSFDGDFTGPPGAYQTDLVIARATDDDGGLEFDFAAATVFIEDVPSSIVVAKTPNLTQQVAGGPVVYTVSVYNSSPVDNVTLISLQDDPYGDITSVDGDITATNCALPVLLLPNDSYECQFTATVDGTLGELVTDTVFVSGVDEVPNVVIGSDSATVEIVDSTQPPPDPSLIVTKVARPTAVPVTDLPAPVGYLVRIFNPNAFAIRILDARDDIYDILADDPAKQPVAPILDCPLPFDLAANTARVCLFTALADGNVGDVITDVVTVEACGLPDCATFTSASDDASVTITEGPLKLAVVKTADPTSVLAPGGPVEFTVEVINTSSSTALTLTTLVDDIYGDITTTGGDITTTGCSVPQALAAAGGRYSCSFTAQVSGVAGTQVVDIVTVTAEDAGGLAVSDSDSARVAILGEFPRVEVTKTASPTSVTTPGGTVTFTTQVLNTSATENLTVDSLVDDIYGDLNGLGNCSTPQVIAPAATYSCSFPGAVAGTSAGLHRDTVELQGRDESGDPLADSDWAVVLILPIGPGGVQVAIPVNPLWLVIGTSLTVLGAGAWILRRRRHNPKR